MASSGREFPSTALTLRIPLLALALWLGLSSFVQARSVAPPPNVVYIFLDDSGWGDFEPFGSPGYKTPNVKKLAEEGTRFNQFYVPSAVCSASRAALLSGCYPGRTGVLGAHGPNGRGLEPKYATLAEILKKQGYATAHYGKWHCGDQPETRPLARGFDEHSGLMYSNDMWRFHPGNPKHWGKFPLQYWRNGEVEIADVDQKDQKYLTKWATERAVDFIKRKKESPFFVYVAHSMPHVPLFCSEEFEGKSGAGLYGDVMVEIDWSVGEIMKVLAEQGLEENTLVFFSSDNGPWAEYGNHAGVTPYRQHKGTTFDGGVRSATIMKLPGRIPAGAENNRAMCTIDMTPTIAKLCHAAMPDSEIDGKDVWPLITGDEGARNPHEYYVFNMSKKIECLITGDGKWKLHVPHRYRHVVKPGNDGLPGKREMHTIELSLFDLESDPYEKTNVIGKYPEIAARLQKLVEQHHVHVGGAK